MNIENIWAEIESDFAWRSDELRFFENQLSFIEDETRQNQFRRAIILLIYSHFEGFTKFAFNLYINAINNENILCKDVKTALKACTLNTVFQALRNSDKKCTFFSRTLPDDTQLHRFSRDLEFLDKTTDFDSFTVNIPDDIIDAESNLKPVVLKKILFKIGINPELFKEFDGTIHRLLMYRNKISHGEMRDGIIKTELDKIRNDTFKVMKGIKSEIMKSLTHKEYLAHA